jgi:hypothetical protein
VVPASPPINQSHSPHLPRPQRVTTRLQASSLNNSACVPLVHPLPLHSCQVTPHLSFAAITCHLTACFNCKWMVWWS